jgi:hypothetical protein
MHMLRPWAPAFGILVMACGAASADPPRTPFVASSRATQAITGAAKGPSPRASGAPLPTASMLDPATIASQPRANAGRDGRFSVERQVVALERALLLYQEFIARAGDDPRYAEAVKRSRDRMRDAKDTLVFLRDDVSGD